MGRVPAPYMTYVPKDSLHYCDACQKNIQTDKHMDSKYHYHSVWYWLGENMPENQTQEVLDSRQHNTRYQWTPWYQAGKAKATRTRMM